ncbi:MAG: adenylate/guanylate cyclase domain-containing protein, partial [Desulfuromonas sp.]
TDDYGQMAVNYLGPVGTFRYLSAIDILNGEKLDQLKDRFVLIGTTAAGLHDLRSTPFSTVYPGVEIHATVIDNLVTGNIMNHELLAERGLTLTLLVAGGLLLSALLAYASPLVGGIGGVLIMTLGLIGNYWFFFRNDLIVGLVYPGVALSAIFLGVTIFNYFSVGREKRFIDLAFSRYISPQVATQLKRDPRRLSLSGTEKELTILFSDIREFTTISERMTAQQLGQFMNHYLTAMGRDILATRGTVDKFIGDAIMALWGAPLDDPQHAQNAVHAALTMQTTLVTLNNHWQESGLPEVKVGIGINTGVVSVGNFGSEERFDYTVLGDAVNLSSRLEGLTGLYGVGIIISEATRQALGDDFFCRKIDRVRVKGKKRPVTIYQPLVAGAPSSELAREVATFEQALELYYDRRFADAVELLEQLQQQSPCRLYSYFIGRTQGFIDTPPSDDWDGVTVHARK